MDKMRCNICDNYLRGIEKCKFCHFEWASELPWTDDVSWDILDIDEEIEWEHLQIQYRLKAKGIECLLVDVWFDSNLVILFGVKDTARRIAKALNVDEDIIYCNIEQGYCIVNLYQEKAIRLGLDEEIGNFGEG